MSVMEFTPFPASGGTRLPAIRSRLAAAFPALRASRSAAHPGRPSASNLAFFNDHMLLDVGLARLDPERTASLRRFGLAGRDDGAMQTPIR